MKGLAVTSKSTFVHIFFYRSASFGPLVKHSFILLFGIFAALVLGSTAAKATDYTFSQTINLADAAVSPTPYAVTADFTTPLSDFDFKVGDTISGTLNFAAGQSISVDPDGFAIITSYFLRSPNIGPVDPQDTSTSTVTLLGLTGDLDASNPSTYSDPGDSIAALDEIHGTTSSFSFTGLDYEITIDSLVDPAPEFAYYGLEVYDDGTAVINLPEPSAN